MEDMKNIIFKTISSLTVLALLVSCGGQTQTVNSNPYGNSPTQSINNLPKIITPNLPKGNISGQVVDYQTKAGISGVRVEVMGIKPVVYAVTNAAGNYTISGVPQGRQVLLVTKKSYSNSSNSNIVVDVKAGVTSNSQQINLLSSGLTQANAFIKTFDGFKHPRGLSNDRTNNEIYVVDVIGIGGFFSFDRSEIKKINSDGGIVDSFGSRIISSNLRLIDVFRLLKKATGIGVDAGGNVYVADTGNNTVKKYGPSGLYLSEIKKDFKDVFDVAVTTRGDVIVADAGNSRVVLLDSSLNVRIENLLKDRPSDGIRGIATDNGDNIYIIDATAKPGEMIKKFDSYGNRLPLQFGRAGGLEPGNFSNPTDLAIDNKTGDIYVVDSGNNRVQRFSPEGNYLSEFGQFGQEPGSFNAPWGISIDNDGYVYISDSKNSRIQKFMPGRVVVNNPTITTTPTVISPTTTPVIQPTSTPL